MARERQGNSPGEKKLEQYGVWVKVRPREVTTTLEAEDSFELTDLEAQEARAESAKEGTLTAEEEELLDELEGELSPGKTAQPILIPDEEPLLSETEELPDIESITESKPAAGAKGAAAFEEEIPQLEDTDLTIEPMESQPQAPSVGEQVEVPLSESVDVKDHFEDLETLETELTSVRNAVSSPRAASSVEILARIEEELRSIRGDLSQLRTELNGLSRTVASPADQKKPEGSKPQGFFDEEEDETIALTGDELDNILNTAEITEEAAESPQQSLSDALEPVGTEEEQIPTGADILSYETPEIVLEEAKPASKSAGAKSRPPAPADVILETEQSPLEIDSPALVDEESLAGDQTVTEEVISLEEESPALAAEEELPSELVLEELPSDTPGESTDAIPEIDLEALAEIEDLPAPAPVAASLEEIPDRSDETIDLESLDLGEEPTIVQAPDNGVENAGSIDGATAETLDELDDGIDLESLSAQVGEAGETTGPLPMQGLEMTDLDVTAEPAEAEALEVEPVEGPAAPQSIEIEFEEGAEQTPRNQTSAATDDLLDLESETPAAESTEELLELEPSSAPEEPMEELVDLDQPSTGAEPTEELLELEPSSAPEEPMEELVDLDQPSTGAEPTEELLELDQPAAGKPGGAAAPSGAAASSSSSAIPDNLKDEIRTVLKYMDTLLEGLPDDKIQEFASSDYFVMYKKLFEDLGIGD